MKVLILPSWYPPDGGSFFKEQSEAVADENVDIDVLSVRIKGLRDILSNPSLYFDRRFKKSNESGLNIFRAIYFKFPFTEKYNIHPWANKALRSFETYIKTSGMPDLIHAHSTLWAGYAAAMISEKYKIPFLITEHRSRFVENNIDAHKLIKYYHKAIIARALHGAAKIILVSNKLKSILLDIEPGINDKTVCIPNFTDVSVFKPPMRPIPERPFIFFSLGNLEHVKGMDILIKAFSILKKNNPGIAKLKIGGFGSLNSELRSQALKLEVDHDITFLGKLSRQQVISHMQGSHSFVLASRFEAFGVVFIEAMACGLPVISSKSGGPEEIINSDVGYLTELDDPVRLSKAMEAMIKQYKEFDPAMIRQHVIDHYSRESTVKQIINIYKEILNENRSA